MNFYTELGFTVNTLYVFDDKIMYGLERSDLYNVTDT